MRKKRTYGVSFESMLDGNTKWWIKDRLMSNIVDYERTHGIKDEFDTLILGLKNLLERAKDDNEVHLCCKISTILVRKVQKRKELNEEEKMWMGMFLQMI